MVAIVIMRSVRVVDDFAFWALDVLDAAYLVWSAGGACPVCRSQCPCGEEG